MAGDTEDLILSISADTKQIQRALQRLTGDTRATTTAIQQQFDDLGNRTAGTFDSTASRAKRSFSVIQGGARESGKAIEASMKASSFQTANLGAQLQDIAVQLKGGASPLTIALQQGTQINQVIGQAGAAGAVKALGGAFVSLVNPVSLATIATIALIGYAVQYFTSVSSGGQKSEETLKQEAALIDQVAQKWGDALPAVKAYADERAKALDLANAKQATNLTIAGFFEDAKKEITELNAGITDLYAQIGDTPGQEAGVRRIQLAFSNLQSAINENRDSTKEVKELQDSLNAVYQNLPLPALKTFSDTVDGMAENWKKAAKNADEARKSFDRATEPDVFDPRDPRFQGPTGPLPSNAPTPGERPSLEDVADTAAAAFIKHFEGFIANAKIDSDGKFRVGFGSDTTTSADGTISAVTKDTVTTLIDAQRDLSRRVQEFQDGVEKAIGSDTFNSLSEQQKAALTDIAYNYGSLPKKIIEAIKGGSPEGIAKAIAGLATDNGGINKNRRLTEAQAFASGTGFSAKEKTPADLFQGKADDVQKRIDALSGEYEAQAKLNPLIKDYGYAAEKAKIEAELLAEAHQAGLEVTPKLAAQISTLAENYAKASAAGDQLKDTNSKIVTQQRELNDLGRGVLGGIIDDLRAGKSAGDIFADVLDKIADKFEDMALNAAFPTNGFGGLLGGAGGGASGGLLGGLIIPGILHDGGIAGVDGYGHGRAVPASTFAGARRYHKGRLPGLASDEFPAILRQGEPVLPSMGALNNLIRGGRSAPSPAGGYIMVRTTNEVVNGNLVPTMIQVSGTVAGQQVKTASKQSPSRLSSYQSRGV
jgi:GH24 family phage-related lysozyme (muramidase)